MANEPRWEPIKTTQQRKRKKNNTTNRVHLSILSAFLVIFAFIFVFLF